MDGVVVDPGALDLGALNFSRVHPGSAGPAFGTIRHSTLDVRHCISEESLPSKVEGRRSKVECRIVPKAGPAEPGGPVSSPKVQGPLLESRPLEAHVPHDLCDCRTV